MKSATAGRPAAPASAPAMLERAVARLEDERGREGFWVGELSTSALSTATAVIALELLRRAGGGERDRRLTHLVESGLTWLSGHQNADGGFGDTVDSPSNVSTTTLAWVALGLDQRPSEARRTTLEGARARLAEWLGELSAESLAGRLLEVYGEDRTFSIPILTTCALGGRFGSGRRAWREVQQIPFELAAVPARWYHRLGLPMVSYALPALIAIGQVRHHHRPSRNPLARMIRAAVRRRTLALLERLQPSSGGFLEAVPLTSFVAMSLVGCGLSTHPVVDRAVEFLASTVRDDGSWPIDSNLSVWLTTLAVNALGAGARLPERLSDDDRRRLSDWLLERQQSRVHPYTGSAPGGWAWTHLPGGVPDADDTSGALLALRRLADAGGAGNDVRPAAAAGISWLLGLQNRDGGIPTFCRGWGKLPFDRSSPDLTAHALRALAAWRSELPESLDGRLEEAAARAIGYLLEQQRPDGSWVPLWFGNQREPELESPLYGTARVLLAAPAVGSGAESWGAWSAAVTRGRDWLVAAQSADGGWGGGTRSPSSVEETGLALEAMATCREVADSPALEASITRGVEWLDRATRRGARFPTSPIGLYFARLWYSERLYPLIFTIAALEAIEER